VQRGFVLFRHRRTQYAHMLFMSPACRYERVHVAVKKRPAARTLERDVADAVEYRPPTVDGVIAGVRLPRQEGLTAAQALVLQEVQEEMKTQDDLLDQIGEVAERLGRRAYDIRDELEKSNKERGCFSACSTLAHCSRPKKIAFGTLPSNRSWTAPVTKPRMPLTSWSMWQIVSPTRCKRHVRRFGHSCLLLWVFSGHACAVVVAGQCAVRQDLCISCLPRHSGVSSRCVLPRVEGKANLSGSQLLTGRIPLSCTGAQRCRQTWPVQSTRTRRTRDGSTKCTVPRRATRSTQHVY
jgi:hypothetical protein